MSTAAFIGARLDEDTRRMVERTAQEEKVDKTRALKELIHLGRRQLLLHRWLVRYRDGTCSLDKAASGARITVHEMMQEAAKAGIRSTQTLQEYRQGFKKLLGNKA